MFSEYYDLIGAPLSKSYIYEATRLLEKFKKFIGEFPPSTSLAVKFIAQFKDKKPNTRARYTYILSAFFNWYSGERLPLKIKVPKILPQNVPWKTLRSWKMLCEARKATKRTSRGIFF